MLHQHPQMLTQSAACMAHPSDTKNYYLKMELVVDNGDPTCSFASQPSSQGIYKSGKTRYLAVAAPEAH